MHCSDVSLSIICPCFNEESTIKIFLEKLIPIMQNVQRPYEVIFINDGSTDNTLNVLLKAKSKNPQIRILNLSRNFGKEAALTAGLEHAMGEVVIPIDADLQHPPEIIIEFIKKWEEGFDVVVGKRTVRTGEGVIKKLTAKYFYKFHNQISDVEIPYNVGDFRLMSRKVIEALKRLPENQRFMKGLFAWVGFNTAVVEYEQAPRAAGKTSYNGWKLWDFALDGITSFSTLPLRIWMYIGFLISFLSFLYGSAIVINTLILGVDTPGYASMITVILFLGGIQLIGIGILGEYIGRIYKETKKRPLYIIEKEY
ncbi:MAG: glycosyltransferase family 2 protein [Desulfobacter sp.]|uniref:glycosyltransferase family 2 protein n=1 Tax=Desulfobacter sp. TaxID=2294 RepID=UPI001B3FC389|nr:glycosyltransferase family 2 protein [Desulfobacter sp.]MBP8829415.1 glycosyltransferase family 2 protein [Desulfobacter sp.]